MSFPHLWLITGFVTKITWHVPLAEQILITFQEIQVHPWFLVGLCCSIFSFLCCVVFCRSFLPLCCPSFYLQLLISSNFSYEENIISRRFIFYCMIIEISNNLNEVSHFVHTIKIQIQINTTYTYTLYSF